MLTPLIEVFLELFIWGMVSLAIIAVVILSVIYMCKSKVRRFFVMIPISICTIGILSLFIVPYTRIVIEQDFKTNFTERSQIVENMKAGQIGIFEEDGITQIVLPEESRSLSKGGGEVLCEGKPSQMNVFFYTFRGFMDHYSGFIYMSDQNKPNENNFNGNYSEIVKMAPHWYWVSSR